MDRAHGSRAPSERAGLIRIQSPNVAPRGGIPRLLSEVRLTLWAVNSTADIALTVSIMSAAWNLWKYRLDGARLRVQLVFEYHDLAGHVRTVTDRSRMT